MLRTFYFLTIALSKMITCRYVVRLFQICGMMNIVIRKYLLLNIFLIHNFITFLLFILIQEYSFSDKLWSFIEMICWIWNSYIIHWKFQSDFIFDDKEWVSKLMCWQLKKIWIIQWSEWIKLCVKLIWKNNILN